MLLKSQKYLYKSLHNIGNTKTIPKDKNRHNKKWWQPHNKKRGYPPSAHLQSEAYHSPEC